MAEREAFALLLTVSGLSSAKCRMFRPAAGQRCTSPMASFNNRKPAAAANSSFSKQIDVLVNQEKHFFLNWPAVINMQDKTRQSAS